MKALAIGLSSDIWRTKIKQLYSETFR